MANAAVCARASPFILPASVAINFTDGKQCYYIRWSTGLHSTLLLFYHHYVLRVCFLFIPTNSFCSFRSCSRSLFVYSFHQIQFQGHRSEIKQSERTNEKKYASAPPLETRQRKKSEVSEEQKKWITNCVCICLLPGGEENRRKRRGNRNKNTKHSFDLYFFFRVLSFGVSQFAKEWRNMCSRIRNRNSVYGAHSSLSFARRPYTNR